MSARVAVSLRWLLAGTIGGLAPLFLAACLSVKFVSDYDPEIDRGVTEFQRRVGRHLAGLERKLEAGGATYGPADADVYAGLAVDLAVLETRAALADKNEITVQQLQTLARQVRRLEAMHQEGIAANDLPPLRTAFAVSCEAILRFELAKRRGNAAATPGIR